ncbi:MAG TPA: GxxExxY protein [Chloroflexota bacterium]|nr:GxxExxY protein [Chloroflexota bacterium]
MTKLLHKELTHKIIRVYYNAYNGLSHTYPEYIYERAMMDELQSQGTTCRRQEEYQIFYKDILVGVQRLDLFVAEEVVVELKVAEQLTKLHKAQAISYLKVTGKQVALLCNFGSSVPQFERLYFQAREALPGGKPVIDWPDNYLSPELTGMVIGALYEVHTYLGPGFIYRIYANALYQELKLRGLAVIPHQTFTVFYHGQSVGQIKFQHMEVEGQLLLFPVAIQNLEDLRIENMKAWLREKQMPLGIVANFYPERLEFKVLRV